ncbi:MAG: hypothetical protein C0506_08110 [Anaerolinea sp.]|nr:hypothetical protein [Anaerolinea sp.]
MSEDRAPRLERLLEATARRVSGGPLHPLELLQRLQAAAEASVRDGAVANEFAVSLSPADHERYCPVLARLSEEAAELLRELARRHRWRRVGEFSIDFRPSREVADGVPLIAAQFAERRYRATAPPAGATRRISRHRGLFLRMGDGTLVPLTHTPFAIGRSPANDLVLPVLSVSRQHAEIVRTPEGLVIRDLGSRNGVVVEGVRLPEYLLDGGGVVVLGDAQFRLERA